jgi:hypothetical protein
MSKLYVVIKVGTEVPELRSGKENTVVQCEAAFLDKGKAEQFFVARNSASKREIVEGLVFDIVRAIHEIEIIE